jgi:ABC-type nitrate/sulfonate/bicarbonate transport system substrate-binding protein
MLRNGKVDAITSQPPFSDQLEKDGFKMILDPNEVFPRRPGKITVATRQTIEQRGQELRAYLRAITRSFWFMRDVSHFEYLKDLEARLRKTTTHNEEELHVAIVTAPDRVDSWAIPVDGAVAADSVKRITDEMVRAGKLPKVRPVKEILRDDAVREAYQAVSSRPELKAALEIARAAERKYGF